MFTTLTHDDALALLERSDPIVLDVRTPGEHARLGHIPGAWLLPVDLIAAAPAVLPDDGRPVLVYCEHGVRSVAAARVLVQAGVGSVFNLGGGLAAWSGPREFGDSPLRGPSAWLLQHAGHLPRRGRVLDVAAGRGRHALLLAGAGFDVRAVDRDAEALGFLDRTAARLGLRVECVVADLETESPPGLGVADAVLVFNYLHRPLMPAIREAVAPGGRLFYETFTTAQAERGRPTNPGFLLEPGELPRLAAPLDVLAAWEGERDGRCLSAVVASRPAGEGAGDG
ncbi:MAG: rhodanese-like domain-containing protein [Acidobacteriota bacterium]